LKGRISDRREIAERVVRGLSSPVAAVVFDVRLVVEEDVESLLKEAGLEVVLRKWRKGDIIVYYVDLRGVWKRCEVEECSDVRVEPDRTRCVKKCFWSSLEGIVRSAAKSLEEVI